MNPRWRRYLRFFGPNVEADVDDELRFHLEMRIREYERLGHSHAQAEQLARDRLGDLTDVERQLRAHDGARVLRAGWSERMSALRMDLRVALRRLRRAPGFVAAVTAILAIGIGMATAMYTIYTAVLVDRLPVAAPDRVLVMHPLDRRGTHLDAPYPYLADVARDSAVFRGAAGVYHLEAMSVPFLEGSTPINLAEAEASANFFDVLGMHTERGRLFTAADGARGAPPVIVLSHAAWVRRFGADPAVIGRTLVIPYTEQRARIVGIAPAGFAYPSGTDLWVQLSPEFTAQVDIIARLAPGVSLAAARSALFALTQRVNPFATIAAMDTAARSAMRIDGVEAHSLVDTVLGSARPALVALTLAVGLLLLIACVNVANLMLVRFLAQQREIAVRRAIGASQGDVVRLLMLESALLALAGGALGWLVATALVHLVAMAAPAGLPRVDALAHAGAPLAAVGVTLFAVLCFGVAPSALASRVGSYAVLRTDDRAGTESRATRRARRLLVAMQMALAVVMISGAGLLARTLHRLESQDLGYQPEHLSILSFTGPRADLPDNQRIFTVAQRVVARIGATPGVTAATPLESGPFEGQSLFIMKLAPGSASPDERANASFVPWEFVGPDYFKTFGIRIREGRSLQPSDSKPAARVVVVSQTLARQMWPGRDPIGESLVNVGANTSWTVVGVATDTHFRELRNAGPIAYFDWDQVAPFWNGFVAVRTTAPLASILPALRRAARDADPQLVLFDARTMDALLDAPLAQPRLSALLLGAFSVVALLLSAIGLYGVMSAGVRQRTRDIGVRMALGATARDVRRLVLSEASMIIGTGAVTGLAAAAFTNRLLASQLFRVMPLDPLSLASAAVLLFALGVAAAYVPARRATRIDPVQALRAE